MDFKQLQMGAYNLNIIRTNKFKTVRVEVKFLRKMEKDEITIRNLLKTVMINSTKKYNDERQIVIKTEDLYDLKLSSLSKRIGYITSLSFDLSFINEMYTEKGMNKESFDFLMEILFHPNVSGGAFEQSNFINSQNKLEQSIMSKKDNKAKYSILQLLSKMGDLPYSYDPYGKIEELKKITPKMLYEYYLSVIKNDFVDIYVIGDVVESDIVNYFKSNFIINTYKKKKPFILLEEVLPLKRVKKIREVDSVQQVKLSIGCRLNGLSDYERRYVLHIYNEILGGSGNSLLFDTVREKNSLAYYISSVIKPYDNILIIYSGIDRKNIDLALKLIKKIMKELSKGKLKEELLLNAKESILSSLDTILDSQTSIINSYYAMDILGSDSLDKRREQFRKVTKDDVVKMASKIKMDTVYLLEGEEDASSND